MTIEDDPSFFEDVPVALARTAADGPFVTLNRAARKLLEIPDGLDASSIDAGTLLVHPEQRAPARALSERDGVSTFEIELRTFRGTTLATEAHLRPVRDDDGKLLYYETALFDQSARKRAESALRERTEYFRTLAEGITDMFVGVDTETRVTYWNAGAVTASGIAARDAVGKCVRDLLPRGSEGLVDALRHAMTDRTQVTFRFESRFAGPARIYAGKAHPMPGGAAFICRDITERERIERSVKRKQQELQRILADQTDLVVRTSADGTILFANPAFCASIGAIEADVVGKSWFSLLPAEHRERVLAERDALSLAQARRVHVVETAGARKYEWRLRGIFDGAGALQEVLAVARDVTPLHAVFAEKEVLLREVHHRVKNNLQIVGSLLNLQFQTIEDPRVHALLAESHRRIQAMALVHEHIYRAPDVAKIDALSYVSALARALRETQIGRRIECVVDVDRVTLDLDTAMRIGLVISELVSNALKHAYPDGRAGEVRIVLRDGHAIELVVSDHGRGLPANFRIEDSPTLGLQLVRQTVEHLGGALTVDGARGARFAIRLPKKRDVP